MFKAIIVNDVLPAGITNVIMTRRKRANVLWELFPLRNVCFTFDLMIKVNELQTPINCGYRMIQCINSSKHWISIQLISARSLETLTNESRMDAEEIVSNGGVNKAIFLRLKACSPSIIYLFPHTIKVYPANRILIVISEG